ncbi:MAG TPA: hypothetical protein DCO86_03090 [Spirochaetaceae bacterium]|nr:hypothetical protein [Spirochaetaceae bacterium]
MASASDYLEFVLEQLRKLEGITYIKMMGEYLLYYKGKIFGGIYNNRLLVKDMPYPRSLMLYVKHELSYDKYPTL